MPEVGSLSLALFFRGYRQGRALGTPVAITGKHSNGRNGIEEQAGTAAGNKRRCDPAEGTWLTARLATSFLMRISVRRIRASELAPRSSRRFAFAAKVVLSFVLSEVPSESSWSHSIRGGLRDLKIKVNTRLYCGKCASPGAVGKLPLAASALSTKGVSRIRCAHSVYRTKSALQLGSATPYFAADSR